MFNPTFTLHDLRQTGPNDITTRWTMRMEFALTRYLCTRRQTLTRTRTLTLTRTVTLTLSIMQVSQKDEAVATTCG